MSIFFALQPNLTLEATSFVLVVFRTVGEIGMEKENGPASLRLHSMV